jgi:hypothetical protein
VVLKKSIHSSQKQTAMPVVIDTFKVEYGTCPYARFDDEPKPESTSNSKFIKSWKPMPTAEFFGKWEDWVSTVGGFSPELTKFRKDLNHI